MIQLWSLARNTLRETLRDRVLYALLVFALGMNAASWLLGALSFAQERKIVLDLGLGTIEFFGVIIAIYVGTTLLFKEIDRRTVYVVLTKPVPRGTFLLGKFLGLMLTLSLLVLAMGGGFALLAWAKGGMTWPLAGAIAMIGLQLMVLVALTLFFSSFASPLLSMVFTFCLYVIGHNTTALQGLARHAAPGTRMLVDGLYYVLPNLSTFELKNQAVYGLAGSGAQWGWAFVYGLAYTVALLASATAIFQAREF